VPRTQYRAASHGLCCWGPGGSNVARLPHPRNPNLLTCYTITLAEGVAFLLVSQHDWYVLWPWSELGSDA
jgi:hypothetical protein